MIRRILKYFLADRDKSELLKGSSSTFLFKVLSVGLSYLFIFLVTRKLGAELGAEAIGIFALSLAVLQIASMLGRFGLETASLRFIASLSAQNKKDEIRILFTKGIVFVVLSSIFLGLILYLIAPYLASEVFHKEQMMFSLRLVAYAVLPLSVLFLSVESLRGLKKITIYGLLKLCTQFFFAIVILLILLQSDKSAVVPIRSYIISVAISGILAFLVAGKFIPLSFKWKNGIPFKKVLHTSMPMVVAGSLTLILGWADTLILGIYRPESEVGVYNVAFKIANLASLSIIAVSAIAGPKFAELHGQGNMGRLKNVIQQSTKLLVWSSIPVFLAIFLFPGFLLEIFGSIFKSAVLVLIMLNLGHVVFTLSGLAGFILQMTGHQVIFRNIIFFALILNVVLNFLLIPTYGINGAAFASMISMIIWNLSAMYFIKRKLGIYTLSVSSFFKF